MNVYIFFKMQVVFFGLSFLIGYSNALIVPSQLADAEAVFFSGIPKLQKGTDSRIGYGFRLGEHADFQVLFEMGPQKFSKPLGGGAPSYDNSDTSKRMVDQFNYSKKKKPVIPRVDSVSSFFAKWTREMKSWARKMKSKMLQKMRKPRKGSVKDRTRKTRFNLKSQYPIPV